jgi:hypothetical protein
VTGELGALPGRKLEKRWDTLISALLGTFAESWPLSDTTNEFLDEISKSDLKLGQSPFSGVKSDFTGPMKSGVVHYFLMNAVSQQ